MRNERLISPWEMLGIFHGDRAWPLIAINRATGHIQAKDIIKCATCEVEAQSWAAALNVDDHEIYFEINPLKGPLGRKARKEDVLEARWVWIDADPLDGLSTPDLEAWRAAKLAEIRASKKGIPPPTMIVDSGRGFWAFWRLRKPEPVDGHGPQTRRVESYGRGLARALGADNCHNIERIARLPGFLNHKTGAKAQVVEYHADRTLALEVLPCALAPTRTPSDVVGEDLALIDDDDAIAAVTKYLTSDAPLAIQGQQGRHTTMILLQRCQDLGCSFETSIDLMEEHWNARCVPPWEPGEIAHTLRGLGRGDPIGCAHPSMTFGDGQAGLSSVGLPAAELRAEEEYPLHFHGETDGPFKKWLLADTLPEVGVGVLSGQSGTYKTFLSFDLAAAVMTKAYFANRAIKRQGGVLFIAAEAEDEVRPRLEAVVVAKVAPALGKPTDDRQQLDPTHLPFAWYGQCPSLQDRAALRKLVLRAREGLRARADLPLALIVIDTLMAAADFKDANDRAEVT